MQSVKRLGGRMLKRSADQADVGAVIAEFKAADDMLEKLIKDLKSWRNEWEDVLRVQSDAAEAFVTLYKAIEPTRGPDQHHVPAETPQQFLQKCMDLEKMYSTEKQELAHEISLITSKVVQPVEQAKLHCKALHKTLKHRENMKLDYERYQSRADHARRKDLKSAKEELSLAKSESDLAQAQIQYETADQQVKETFPPVVEAVYALMPYIAANQVMLHTTLVGQLYTSLDEFCRQHGLPSPAPRDDEIIASWESEYTVLRKELESGITLISHGKAVHMPMTIPPKSGTVTGMGIRNKVLNRKPDAPAVPSAMRKPSPQPSITYDAPLAIEEPAPPKPPRPGPTQIPSPRGSFRAPSPGQTSPGNALLVNRTRVPSPSSLTPHRATPPPYDQKPTLAMPGGYPKPATPSWLSPGHALPPGQAATSPGRFGASAGADYFSQAATAATLASAAASASQDPRRSSAASFASSTASSVAGAAAAAKKKPPPPVPVKRLPSGPQAQFVVALYDFEGQNAGDLAFREGDRIRVVKKTGSTDDWWDGELAGRTGSFPANYVQV